MTPGKPQWWQIYMLGAAIAGLLLLAHFVFADVTARHIAQIGIVLIGYRLILAWLGSHASAIECEGWTNRDETAHGHDLPITE